MFEFQLLANYGYGWDLVVAEDTRGAILDQLKVYRLNDQHALGFKIKRVRMGA